MSKRALSTGGKVNESLKWEVFAAPGIPTDARESGPTLTSRRQCRSVPS